MKFLRRILSSENLIPAVILLLACSIGLGYYRDATESSELQAKARFEARSEMRHARLLGELAEREQLLRSVVAYFNASTHVSADEFAILSNSVLSEEALKVICWHSADGESQYSGETLSDVDPCAHFDPSEPTRLVHETPPLIVLSEIAANKDQQQYGHASIVFEIADLLSREPAEGLNEYLVVHGLLGESSTTYTHSGGRLQVVPELSLVLDETYREFGLRSLGSVHFRYLTRQLPKADGGRPEATIALFFMGLGLLTALYSRNLIRTRDVVRHEVQWRTAELSQFAYRTSHDLRGPLVTVGALCRALREDVDDGEMEDVVDNAERIENHVERLDKLVGDILQLTEADLGSESVEVIDFADLLKDIHGSLGVSLPGHRVATEVDIQPDGDCMMPRARLSRVLENLISNSIKYSDQTQDRSFVRTTVRQQGEAVTIEVRDNGLGIPKQFHSQLFSMFERYHPGVGVQGSGLGLSIVKKHVDRLGGRIDFASSSEGTAFTLHLSSMGDKTS